MSIHSKDEIMNQIKQSLELAIEEFKEYESMDCEYWQARKARVRVSILDLIKHANKKATKLRRWDYDQ
jgi:hypothetical protein